MFYKPNIQPFLSLLSGSKTGFQQANLEGKKRLLSFQGIHINVNKNKLKKLLLYYIKTKQNKTQDFFQLTTL